MITSVIAVEEGADEGRPLQLQQQSPPSPTRSHSHSRSSLHRTSSANSNSASGAGSFLSPAYSQHNGSYAPPLEALLGGVPPQSNTSGGGSGGPHVPIVATGGGYLLLPTGGQQQQIAAAGGNGRRGAGSRRSAHFHPVQGGNGEMLVSQYEHGSPLSGAHDTMMPAPAPGSPLPGSLTSLGVGLLPVGGGPPAPGLSMLGVNLSASPDASTAAHFHGSGSSLYANSAAAVAGSTANNPGSGTMGYGNQFVFVAVGADGSLSVAPPALPVPLGASGASTAACSHRNDYSASSSRPASPASSSPYSPDTATLLRPAAPIPVPHELMYLQHQKMLQQQQQQQQQQQPYGFGYAHSNMGGTSPALSPAPAPASPQLGHPQQGHQGQQQAGAPAPVASMPTNYLNVLQVPLDADAQEVLATAEKLGYLSGEARRPTVVRRATMVVVDPDSCKLAIPFADIKTTRAVYRPGVPSLCLLHLRGACRQATRCHQVHAAAEFVTAMRREVAAKPNCCFFHGDRDRYGLHEAPPSAADAAAGTSTMDPLLVQAYKGEIAAFVAALWPAVVGPTPDAELQAAVTTALLRRLAVRVLIAAADTTATSAAASGPGVPLGAVAVTTSARRLLASDAAALAVELQRMPDGAAVVREALAGVRGTSPPTNPKTPPGGGDPSRWWLRRLTTPAGSICRLHAGGRCRYNDDCRFLHVCKEECRSNPALCEGPPAGAPQRGGHHHGHHHGHHGQQHQQQHQHQQQQTGHFVPASPPTAPYQAPYQPQPHPQAMGVVTFTPQTQQHTSTPYTYAQAQAHQPAAYRATVPTSHVVGTAGHPVPPSRAGGGLADDDHDAPLLLGVHRHPDGGASSSSSVGAVGSGASHAASLSSSTTSRSEGTSHHSNPLQQQHQHQQHQQPPTNPYAVPNNGGVSVLPAGAHPFQRDPHTHQQQQSPPLPPYFHYGPSAPHAAPAAVDATSSSSGGAGLATAQPGGTFHHHHHSNQQQPQPQQQHYHAGGYHHGSSYQPQQQQHQHYQAQYQPHPAATTAPQNPQQQHPAATHYFSLPAGSPPHHHPMSSNHSQHQHHQQVGYAAATSYTPFHGAHTHAQQQQPPQQGNNGGGGQW